MRLKLFLILSLFALTACDPGRKAINKLEDEYAKLKEAGPVRTEEAATKFASIHSAADILHSAYPDRGSGKRAKELQAKMEADYVSWLPELRPSVTTDMTDINAAEKEVTATFDKVRKRVKKRDLKWNAPFPFKEGDCIARAVGGEFSKLPSYASIEILRLEKMGDEKVLLRPLYSLGLADGPKIYEQKAQSKEPEEEYKNLIKDETKFSCEETDELIRDFDRFSAIVKRGQASLVPVAIMAALFKRNLQMDLAPSQIARETWISNILNGLPAKLCEPKQYIPTCYKLNDDQCRQVVSQALKPCIEKVRPALPESLKVPQDNEEWVTVVVKCMGADIEKNQFSKRIDSDFCRDDKNFIGK